MMAPVAAALLMALPSSAALPQLAEPTPTDVTLAWESVADGRIAVTWQETGSLRNEVLLVQSDGSFAGWGPTIVEADRPDRATFSHLGGSDRSFRVTVRAVDADDRPTSDTASSAAFDADRPPVPVIESVVPAADDTVTMRWRPGPSIVDRTPGDPLDLPAENPPTFVPIASVFTFREFDTLGPLSAATSTVFRDRRLPAWLGVRTSDNGWGVNTAVATITGTRFTAVVPRTATTGARLRVTGKAYRVVRACDPGPCFTVEWPDAKRTIELQSRTGATAPWRVVSSTTSTSDGDFRFSVVSPGSRQYRVVAQPVPLGDNPEARTYFATAPVSTTSRPALPTPTPSEGSGAGEGPGTGGGSTGGGGGLAITGAPVATVAGSGGLLVAVGVLLCWAARRRRAS